MNLERMCHAELKLKLALGLLCCFASLVLLPARSSAQINGGVDGGANVNCANPNPNPNPNPTSFAAVGDFNGDCKSDVLWRNTNSEQAYIWLMSGISTSGRGNVFNPSSDWVIQGVGDFDEDGKADILWRNSTTGQVYIWLMNGTTIAGQGSLGNISSDWSIQGVGDFDGDGKADILWRNSTTGQAYIWLMNGLSIASQGGVFNPSSDWNILGVGDFNGDGKADILWQNSTTGQAYIWLMNGLAIASQGGVFSVSPDWSIQGVGDFNGDGKSDILWRNSTTGQAYIWLMNGTVIASQGNAASPAAESSTQCCSGVGNGWTVMGVGDFDGDGKADILWRQLTSGQVYAWLMNGTSIATQGGLGVISADWQLATLSPYGCLNQVLCNILSATNNVRANGPFGAGNPTPSSEAGGPLFPLIWDQGAATTARNWAAQCNFNHNPNRDGGESIYASCSNSTPVTITGTDAVSSWSAEANNYVYPATGGNCTSTDTTLGCGHYTQLVWRTTTAVGCAVQQCTTNSPCGGFPDWAFVVCDYTPAGNWTGVSPY